MDPGSAEMWVLPSDPTAARQARVRIDEACLGMAQNRVDVARLLVTELVTNALQHGAGTVVLLIARDGGAVRVHVEDESPAVPKVLEPQPWAESGAGMRLVAMLADSWGVESRSGGLPGKRVWFALG